MRRILGLEVGWLLLTRVGGSRGEDLVPAPAVSRPAGLDRLLARGPARAGGARRAHEGVPPAQPTRTLPRPAGPRRRRGRLPRGGRARGRRPGLPLRRHPHRPDGPTGRHCTCRCGGAPHPGAGRAGCPRVGPPGGEAGGAQPAAGGGPSRRHQPGRPSVVRGRARPGGAIGSGVHSPQRRPDEQLGDEEAGNEVEATGTGPSPRASSHRSSGSDRNGAMLTT